MTDMTHPDDPAFFFPAPRLQHFCGQCGTPITRRIPPGDNRERDLCEKCGAVHYQNPRMVVGTVPVWEGKILLCLRAIEPRAKYLDAAGWVHGACLKARPRVPSARHGKKQAPKSSLGHLYTVIDIPQVDQVHIYFLANVTSPELDPGPESLDAKVFCAGRHSLGQFVVSLGLHHPQAFHP